MEDTTRHTVIPWLALSGLIYFPHCKIIVLLEGFQGVEACGDRLDQILDIRPEGCSSCLKKIWFYLDFYDTHSSQV